MTIEIIREFSDELLEAMRSLLPQLTSSVRDFEETVLKNILKEKNTSIFVVRSENNEIIGTLTLVVFTIPTSKKAYIEDVVVDSNQQGKGIGRKLMEAAINYAKEQGVSRVELTSNPTRIAANRLYQSLGFEVRNTNYYRLQL